MRNNSDSLARKILSLVEHLPYFRIENLEIMDVPPYHLRIVLSRLEERGGIIRLKKGIYTPAKFVEGTKGRGMYTAFVEFIATKIYAPSYLSLDYVLYENNVLTEVPVSLTLITKNKTYTVPNNLGRFIYHKIKEELFCGYQIEKKNGYIYYKADKVKALFDFLYLRKNRILNREMAEELRLNLEIFSKAEIRKLRQYIEQEGSGKMKEIFRFLF
jgi:predicted transcriptional regulator of viral defense system